MAILIPSADSRRVVRHKPKHVDEVLVNCKVKLAQDKLRLSYNRLCVLRDRASSEFLSGVSSKYFMSRCVLL